MPGNECDGIAAIDLLTVRTALFDQLYALVVLSLDRRRFVSVTATVEYGDMMPIPRTPHATP